MSTENDQSETVESVESVETAEIANVDLIKKLYDRQMRIELTDGRHIIGQFLCTDREANMVLGEAVEFGNDQIDQLEPRSLGLVTVARKNVTRVFLTADDAVLLTQ